MLGLTLTRFSLSVTEGSASSVYYINISGSILDLGLGNGDCVDVSVSVDGATGTGQLMVSGSPEGETFTVDSTTVSGCGANGALPAIPVYVTAVDDSKIEGKHFITMSHRVARSTGSLQGILAPANITILIDDNEKAGLILTTNAHEVKEGESLILTARLTHAPPNKYAVTVNLVSSDTGTYISPSSIKFAGINGRDWNVDQAIIFTVASDGGYAFGNRNVSISASCSSLASVYQNVNATIANVTVVDVDTAGLTVSPSTIRVTEVQGFKATSTAQLSIKLNSRPMHRLQSQLIVGCQIKA